MSSTNNQAPAEAICSQLTSHQLKDLSLLVQVAPPASQIGRQEATGWQVGVAITALLPKYSIPGNPGITGTRCWGKTGTPM